MARDEHAGERQGSRVGRILALALLVALLALPVLGQATTETSITGTLGSLHSDKRVVQNGRWFLVRQFTVDFAVRDSNRQYCGEIVTTDATEATDLINSSGQAVEVAEKGKDIYLTLKNGRKIKAHHLSPDKCPRAS